jgi:DNA-binding transcriptional LysR family regulator
VGERGREGALNPGLAGDEVALGDDDSPPDGPVLEGGADRLKLPHEPGPWPGIAEPRITFTARDWPTRLGLVAAGLGIALVPGIAAQAVPRGVRWIPIHDDTGGLRRTVWAATNDHPSEAAAAMVRALEAEASS